MCALLPLLAFLILFEHSAAASKYGGPCCPIGWILYNADNSSTQPKCAKAVKDWNTNFAQSEKACDLLGGRLISVHTTEQNKMIYDMITSMSFSKPNYVWIGLTKSPTSDENQNSTKWYWSDGSTTKYTNWLKGYPVGRDSHNNCAIMYTKAGQFESKF
uniref:C-type lectin domain-containing protein n=1 Tax=Plectus sambesii TaxID=2011161 RepID=A0A914X517_9BILA